MLQTSRAHAGAVPKGAVGPVVDQLEVLGGDPGAASCPSGVSPTSSPSPGQQPGSRAVEGYVNGSSASAYATLGLTRCYLTQWLRQLCFDAAFLAAVCTAEATLVAAVAVAATNFLANSR